MRKFNLKEKAAERMKNPDIRKQTAEQEEQQAESPVPGFAVVSRTDVGRVRKSNQDALIIGEGAAGVADGMGGHNGGEIASAGLRDGLLRETEGQEPSMELLEEAVKKVNYEIWEQQEKDASLTGMGTTLTILWAAGKEMIIGQVGDSRAYLLRDGQLKQVTSDHSMVADMVRRGVLTEEQAACHPMRNYITRAVGTDDTLDVDMITIPRMNGDRWIICSDGLYGQISKQELEETAKIADLEEAAGKLLELALEHGGRDNITLVLMQDESAAEEQEPAGTTEEEPAGNVVPENADQEGGTEE